MISLVVSALGSAGNAVELVEYKSLGHPDTICDALAEARLDCVSAQNHANS